MAAQRSAGSAGSGHRFAVHYDVKILPGDREGVIELAGRPSAKYLSRPPIALSRMRYGDERDPLVRIRLKRPHWKTGRRELVFDPGAPSPGVPRPAATERRFCVLGDGRKPLLCSS